MREKTKPKEEFETEILKGISQELNNAGLNARVIAPRVLRVSEHCSFRMEGSRLVKQCSMEHKIELANPDYISDIMKVIELCSNNFHSDVCLDDTCILKK